MTEAPYDPNDPSAFPAPGEGTGWPQTHARDALAFLDEVRIDTRTLAAEHAEARSILRQLLADPCCDHLSAVTVGRARKLMGDG